MVARYLHDANRSGQAPVPQCPGRYEALTGTDVRCLCACAILQRDILVEPDGLLIDWQERWLPFQ